MTQTSDGIRAEIPLPIQIVLDDVGWWSGRDGNAQGEPFRTGIERDHVPADYAAIVSLGRQLGMKPQAAFILGEWDKHNILRRVPSCNWMGADWDNARWVGPWYQEAAQIVRDGASHLELTLHGVGHEYWSAAENGQWQMSRAEWHDADGNMRPRDQVLAHLDLYGELLDQHNLGAFPTSYAVCAGNHRFVADGSGLASIFKQAGIDFISTPFSCMKGIESARPVFDFDDGVMTVDRVADALPWNVIADVPNEDLSGPICGLHWPNILHPDPQRNEEIVDQWVIYLQKQNQRPDRMLAPDTAAFALQLAHHTHVTRHVDANGMRFDFSQFDDVVAAHRNGEFCVKIVSPQPLNFTSDDLEIGAVQATPNGAGIVHQIQIRRPRPTKTAQLQWHSSTQPFD